MCKDYIYAISSAVYACDVHLVRRDQFRSHAMEFMYFVNLIFIFFVNILFFFSGICLNSLVIVSFRRSVQLRKKLCHFTIMILSCCDLLVVLTNHPVTALVALLWLTEKIIIIPGWLVITLFLSNASVIFSLLALFVMNVDRYLATYYPIFHRTSVTKGKLLTLFAFLVNFEVTVVVMSMNNFLISYEVGLVMFYIIFIPPMLFINYKLFRVARKTRRQNEISSEMKRSFSLKTISSCLLAVVCLIILFIPGFVYIVLRLTSKEKGSTMDNVLLAALWTCNCLIFYWRDKILRAEGREFIKSIRICRRVQS